MIRRALAFAARHLAPGGTWADRLALGLYLVVLALLLIPPRPSSPAPYPHADKVVHFALFGGLALLAMRTGRPAGWPDRTPLSWPLLAAAIASAAGVLTEIAQWATGWRKGDGPDAVADALGALVFAFAYRQRIARLAPWLRNPARWGSPPSGRNGPP